MSLKNSLTVAILRGTAGFTYGLRRLLTRLSRRQAIAIVITLIILVTGYGVYEKYFNLTDAERAQKELKAAMSAVSKHMILPEGDEPVLATVTDAEALTKQQAFFTGAVNGDQLLLFPRNLKAILYSPSRNKIVNAGPIEQQPRLETTGSQANPVSNGASQNSNIQNTLTVEVRNGTGKKGLATQAADNLRAAGFEVISVADAKNKNYLKTILATRTDDNAKSQLAAALAAQIGAEFITKLPSGEKNTEADALIIIGGK